ncbi:MAG: hypothetical protein LBT51_02395 [Fusobacteriaceae bacterium]|jgi:hypothetical protein|nr:hypothetical protein [Fusobacteriaceae bacterium]
MIDFNLINLMIENIENSFIPPEHTFNSYAIEFFNQVKLIPFSKYLLSIGKTKRLPKIMYFKKAGELLSASSYDQEIKSYLKRNNYDNPPELNFKSILLLRKTNYLSNWRKIISFFDGKGSIEEINRLNRLSILPQELELLEYHIKKLLNINDNELKWLLTKYAIIKSDKKLLKSFQKVLGNFENENE